MSSSSFVKGNHSVGLNEFHFEWCPKYRYECMKKEYINKEIEQIIKQTAKEYKIMIKSIAVGFDHVHIHAVLPFDMSVSRALMLLKGRSAYMIFRRFPNFRKRYPKGNFWSPGKFSRSISEVTSAIVDNYIEKQTFDKLVLTDEKQRNLCDFF